MNTLTMKQLDKRAWLFAGIHTLVILNVVVDLMFAL